IDAHRQRGRDEERRGALRRHAHGYGDLVGGCRLVPPRGSGGRYFDQQQSIPDGESWRDGEDGPIPAYRDLWNADRGWHRDSADRLHFRPNNTHGWLLASARLWRGCRSLKQSALVRDGELWWTE